MFPYRVDNPRIAGAPATWAIIALNVLVWVVVEGMGADANQLCSLGLIPSALLGHLAPGATVPLGQGLSCSVGSIPAWLTPLTSMFMHGGWFHLIGNMWFLWLFGPNVEDIMGSARYAGFYLLAGLAAAAAQVLADPHSTLPMVGASGAISGVMGAYVVLFPRVRVHILVFLGIFLRSMASPRTYWTFEDTLTQIGLGVDPGRGVTAELR